MRLRSWILAGIVLYACIWVLLLLVTLRTPASSTFASDAAAYSDAAVHLLRRGVYSIDGVQPTIEREPGQSVFLALVYALFGIENRVAIFAVQASLFVLVSFLFVQEFHKRTSERVATLLFFLLLLFPASFHVVFSANRESLALSLGLLAATVLLRYERLRAVRDAFVASILLGLLILTYMPFLLLPLVLGVFLAIGWRVRWPHLGILVLTPMLFATLWGIRNTIVSGSLCLSGCQRPAAVAWYVRGEQAQHLRGLEPLKCLWAEYISRDWTGRSPACSFNNLKNRRWPEGFHPGELEQDLAIVREGQGKILRHFGWYLWFSLFEILELHLPYVNGWGFLYNVAAAIGTVVLYAGVFLGIGPVLRRRDLWLLLVIPAYAVGVFILTDATPRYLMPVIFCYAAIAAVGYDRFLRKS